MDMTLDLTAHLMPLFAALTVLALVSAAAILAAGRRRPRPPAASQRPKWPRAA
jgi:hypothetical protein